MLHSFVFNELAIVVRHWFEVGAENEEHGARVEIRELVQRQRRGSESAPQIVELDGIVWRADLFDVYGSAAGDFACAHYHSEFDGIEPTGRQWDSDLTADPFGWLHTKLHDVSTLLRDRGVSLRDPKAEVEDIRRAAPEIVAVAQQYAPANCRSSADCLVATRDTAETVALMLALFRNGAPDPRLGKPEN